MKPHNDSHIKNIFEEREITPSKKSWDTLSKLLDENIPDTIGEKHSKKSIFKTFYFKYTLPIAAAIVLFYVLDYRSFTNEFKSDTILDNGKTVTVIETPQKLNEKIKEEYISPDLKASEIYNSVIKPQNLAGTESLNTKPVYEQDSVIKESSIYVNNTIQINWDNSKIKKTVVLPNELLRSVERELLQDRVEQELEKSQNKFEQIRMAILNRNIEE